MADIIKNRNYPPFKTADYVNIEARYQEMMGHVIAEP
jgi:hypothetical protein